jgi:uncharacterized paraquat-inducible protein A
MNTRNIIALILIIISLCCLYPGLVKPILSIKIGAVLPIVGELSLHESTQSIISTIEELYENKNTLVASLILIFSVVVPVLKALLLLLVMFVRNLKSRKAIHKFVSIIGKWSMADVFVVGVFLAYLSTKSDNSINSQLHEGFYYFLAYCIISLIAIQIMDVKSLFENSEIEKTI